MKKRFVKEVAVLGILAVLGRNVPAYAGWQQKEDVWKYEQGGSWVMNSWVKENNIWYYLEQDGKMAVGWKQIDGLWYFFQPISGGTGGQMMTGWQWIDGRCYYLAESEDIGPEGAMYAGRQTPDGYWVEESGAWVDENGEVVEAFGKGILTEQSLKKAESGRGGSSRGGGSSGRGGSNGRGGSSRGGGSNSGGGNRGGGSGSRGRNSSGDESSSGDRFSSENDEKDMKRPDSSQKKEDSNESLVIATSSNARMVKWYVRFVDEDTHQILLAETRHGKIQDGEELTINFQGRIVDSENQIWESVSTSPLNMEIYGPGSWNYDVEYRLTGKLPEPSDPEEKDRERLRKWLDKAKEQESKLTGEDIKAIPDSRFLVSGQRENDGRVLTAAGQIPDFSEFAFYVIGINTEPNGMVLQDFYGEEIEHSEWMEDQFILDGSVYTIIRFSVKRKKSQENCSHQWEIVSQQEAGCMPKGRLNFQCKRCRQQREIMLAPKGHRDEDLDGNCEDCQESMEKDRPETIHWDIGDMLSGEIDGETYSFRCIDQNYSDQAGNHRQGALFLCDSVIPANIGSGYSYELLEDGSCGYVFSPGPVVNFGDSNDYKYSNVRSWLQESEENFPYAEDIELGVSMAYAGSTGHGMYSQLQRSDLRGSHIGNQKLTGRLFILSVDEALKYSKWLWRFDGSEKENPQSQIGMFSGGYWLRSPMGTAWDHDTDFVYAVDLVNGVIRPVGILPERDTEDEELQVTCTIGVRPAFVMPQEK